MSDASLFAVQGPTIVTGANGGIGLSLVAALAAAGSDIIAVQLTDDDAAVKVAESLGRKGWVYVCDQRRPEEVEKLVPRILQDGHNPTVLLCCTGINIRGTTLDFKQEWLESLLQVNVMSQFVIARDFAGHRIAQSDTSGKIIFMASTTSFCAGVEIPGYATSKHALLGTMRAMSNEFAPYNIQVNAICPGHVDTTFTTVLKENEAFRKSSTARIPAGRWGVPSDIDGPVIFLASAASNYVSGAAIPVDGGFLAR